jgi:hypothetical protein
MFYLYNTSNCLRWHVRNPDIRLDVLLNTRAVYTECVGHSGN